MEFTRVNLVESIIYVIEKSEDKSFEIKKLYNKVKKIIHVLPDEEIFKFQFLITIKSIEKLNISSEIKVKDYIIFNNSIVSDFNVNYNNTIDVGLDLKLDNINLKKILIDIKNNYVIYHKLDRDTIFDILIKNI